MLPVLWCSRRHPPWIHPEEPRGSKTENEVRPESSGAGLVVRPSPVTRPPPGGPRPRWGERFVVGKGAAESSEPTIDKILRQTLFGRKVDARLSPMLESRETSVWRSLL